MDATSLNANRNDMIPNLSQRAKNPSACVCILLNFNRKQKCKM